MRLKSDADLTSLHEVWEELPESEWYLVGGMVRDIMLGREEKSKDHDFVVRKVSLQQVEDSLEGKGKVSLVGKTFGVLKFTPEGADQAIDIAWPRKEKSTGAGGYRDFDVQSDSELPVEDDLARRDLTINAMAWDVRHDRLVDPFGGRDDVENKVLRAVGEPKERFAEDYSRMLRTLRFACQLGFEIEEKTWQALTDLMPHLDDRVERVRERKGKGTDRMFTETVQERVVPYELMSREFAKALDADPVKAIDLFERSGALFRIFPELKEMRGCAQSPDHHSEGDVWTHSKLSVERLMGPEFAKTFPGERPSVETVLAVLLHDVGKPDTQADDGERITFYGHDHRGAEIVSGIESRLRFSSVEGYDIDPERLYFLVQMHLFPNSIDLNTVKRTTLERYFLADPGLGRQLLHMAFADASASIPEGGEPDLTNLARLMEVLEEVRAHADVGKTPKGFVTGHDVMEITGLEPGAEVGKLLHQLREAQLSGEVATEEDAKRMILDLHAKE